jgi:hypothetical protein
MPILITVFKLHDSRPILTVIVLCHIHSFTGAYSPGWTFGLFQGFLSHARLDTRQDSSERVISPSQRPLPTHDNTTYKHNRQTSMPRAVLEPATPATKQSQTYALDRAATGISTLYHKLKQNVVKYSSWPNLD